jgi:tetratricopeptide (TPR) repeat protein
MWSVWLICVCMDCALNDDLAKRSGFRFTTAISMQDQELPQTQMGFVQSRLPWVLAGAALVTYLVLLNHWVSVASLPIVARVTGWDWWTLNLQAPVFYLVTWPVKWLPGAWQVLALNSLSALFAAVALGLLARCVAILPHDRTRDQRQREGSDYSFLTLKAAWVPPLVAVSACGLQLTFWEHATAATGESLNLLLFAYLVRCLLEHRLDERDHWLYQLAFVYGISVTNNWAMIGFFPIILVSLVWIKGLNILRWPLLIRMAGFGILGLSLYLLLPALAFFGANNSFSFWQLFKAQLVYQKLMITVFPKYVLLLCGLTSFLPVLFMGIRWPSTLGDTSIIGSIVSQLLFRVVHLLFLAACVWIVFDPPFSPRHLGFGMSFLPFYFLSALSIGYFAGYFLLIGQDQSSRRHRQQGLDLILSRLMYGVVWLGVLALPAGLIYRNLPLLKINSGSDLKRLAQHLVDSLPNQPCIVLSDEPLNLLLLSSAANSQNGQASFIPVDTRSLLIPSYQKQLHQRYPQRWPDLNPEAGQSLDSIKLVQQLQSIGRSNDFYYLHPSVSFYAEGFYRESRGLVYHLTAYPPRMVYPPAPSEKDLADNQSFWTQRSNSLEQLSRRAPRRDRDNAISDARFAADFYSRALNCWAVALLHHNDLDKAIAWLKLAFSLNPDNAAAAVNLAYAEKRRTSSQQSFVLDEKNNDLIRGYRNMHSLLSENGPIDEPSMCLRLGKEFSVSAVDSPAFLRQAAQAFQRVLQLEPHNTEASIWLGNIYLKGKQPENALEIVKKLQTESATLSPSQKSEIVRMEAWALFAQNNLAGAESVLANAQQLYPTDSLLPECAFQMNLMSKRFTNALIAIEQQLKLDPKNTKALLNQGALLIQLQAFDKAIQPLSQVLAIESKNDAALMNRAIAYLQSGKLDEAEADYQKLLDLVPRMHAAYYGLGEIADQRKNTQKAISFFESFLKYAPPNTVEIKAVEERLRVLKTGR